ncbi:polysaccharide deacetylase family protein [Novosphingobium sp. G106]|uniref:polysaccharide deacetylase family protein n=1 Tax=Novosphingobium sp. G106 TaxID=2849500 RepID=UPI001C2D4008|nr:polysaccharide deacetylase family protein [Novosphingobium sp. G106]MBV1687732.1 polysaccharide deacetylase family protein [Novosphingobium sp. G106]
MIDRRTALLTLLIGTLAPPGFAGASSFRGGVVSLTYDDGLDSQLDIAWPALDSRGLHGTFYVTLENIAERAADWQELAAKGHELANHTASHPCDLRGTGWRTYGRTQLAPVNRALGRWDGTTSRRDFAYPCDVTDLGPGSPNQQMRRFEAVLRANDIASARTSEGPPNSLTWARRHPFRLKALAAGFDATRLSELTGYLRSAQLQDRWAILVFHDLVRARPSEGQFLAETHDALLDAILKMSIRCHRVCDVMKEMGA